MTDEVEEQFEAIPNKNFYHADKYNTDNEAVIHLWDDDGHSYDVRIPRP
jgi:hypothetical protein